MMTSVCDECGQPATQHITGMTGRILIDGVDNNLQGADLCEAHAVPEGGHQPVNCVHVKFYWAGMPEWNV